MTAGDPDSLGVLFADNHLLVVDKPAGLPIQADRSRDPDLLTLAKAWIKRQHDKPGDVYLGLVHRLDRPVSGVVILARTSKAASRLAEEFREQRARKTYLAVCARAPEPRFGVLEQWLIKERDRNFVRAVNPGAGRAQRALTEWRTLGERRDDGGRRVLVELEPRTGRPHQLRVALATLGAPILGDLRYGAAAPLPDASVALHALRLAIAHPTQGRELVFECRPPDQAWWRFPDGFGPGFSPGSDARSDAGGDAGSDGTSARGPG